MCVLIFDLSYHHGNRHKQKEREDRTPNITLRLLHQETNCLTEVTIQKAQTWVRGGDNRCNKPDTLAGMAVGSDSKDIVGVAVWIRVVYRVFPGACTELMYQSLFFFFFGTTVASDVCGGPTSPYSDEHTPGGSTGGEPAAALLVYGWLQLQTVDQDATDVAGSIRIPVHN